MIAGYAESLNPITDLPLIVFGDHSCTVKYIDLPFLRGADGTQLLKVNAEELLPKYFYFYLQQLSLHNQDRYERHFKYLKAEKIPHPPLNIQQQIVAECDAVDADVAAAHTRIITSRNSIESAVGKVFNGVYPLKKLGDAGFSVINPSKSAIKDVDDDTMVTFIEMAAVSEEGFIINPTKKPLKELRKGSYTYFAENDIILAKITPCMENGKCALAKGLTNGLGMGSTEFHVIRANQDHILPGYLFAVLNRKAVREAAEKVMTGASGHRRVPPSFYEDMKVPVPTLADQKRLVAQIEVFEKTIADAQAILAAAPAKKQAIMQRYL